MSEKAPISPEATRPLCEEALWALGALCLETAARNNLEDVVTEHLSYSSNPNGAGQGLFVAGEVPMNSDNVYRQVGAEAIIDLATSGIVRNGATAQGKPHERWGHKVFWNKGEDDKKIGTGGRFVLETSKVAADAGWVTADKLIGIHTRMPDGQVKNILDTKR